MPKSRIRCKHMDRRGSSCSDITAIKSGVARRSLLLSTSPRRVSFEDSRNNSNSSIRSDDTAQTKNEKNIPESETVESERKKRQPITRKRSMLVRPITSHSLVDLARSALNDSVSPMISGRRVSRQLKGNQSKSVCCFNMSPQSIIQTSNYLGLKTQNSSSLQPLSQREKDSITTSPWGYFIDMTPYGEKYDILPISDYPNYDIALKSNIRGMSHCTCKEPVCRIRRRPSPYSKMKSHIIRKAHPILNFDGIQTDSVSKSNFQLSLRREGTSHEVANGLIGLFSELQVRHVQQKAGLTI